MQRSYLLINVLTERDDTRLAKWVMSSFEVMKIRNDPMTTMISRCNKEREKGEAFLNSHRADE
jgi:succinate dehydrogenase flavin-adding protein (antitoxin of CptAB toxin-antitoxin module)